MTPQFRSMLGSLAGLLLASSTVQAATIGFDPDVTIASPGDAFVVDVVVSDLGGEIVGAYDLDVVFDASVVSASSVTFSAALGGAAEAFLDFRVAPGLVDLAGVSLLSDAALLARQGGERVTLASLHFTKTGEGSSPLAFVFDAANDVKGAEARVLALAVSPGAVRGPREVIPEPSGALTFATGLSVTTWALRRRSRRVPVRSR